MPSHTHSHVIRLAVINVRCLIISFGGNVPCRATTIYRNNLLNGIFINCFVELWFDRKLMSSFQWLMIYRWFRPLHFREGNVIEFIHNYARRERDVEERFKPNSRKNYSSSLRFDHREQWLTRRRSSKVNHELEPVENTVLIDSSSWNHHGQCHWL